MFRIKTKTKWQKKNDKGKTKNVPVLGMRKGAGKDLVFLKKNDRERELILF